MPVAHTTTIEDRDYFKGAIEITRRCLRALDLETLLAHPGKEHALIVQRVVWITCLAPFDERRRILFVLRRVTMSGIKS
jgi:hypothetical protein